MSQRTEGSGREILLKAPVDRLAMVGGEEAVGFGEVVVRGELLLGGQAILREGRGVLVDEDRVFG